MANEPKEIAERHPRVDMVELQRAWRGTPSILLVWRVGEMRIGHGHLSWNDDGDGICVSWRTFRTVVTDRTGRISRLPFNLHPWSVGGHRPLMQCPGCAQRVKTLYLANLEWACRDCHGFIYRSQASKALFTLDERIEELERPLTTPMGRLGRPKNMHRATYERKVEELQELRYRRDHDNDLVPRGDLLDVVRCTYHRPADMPGLLPATADDMGTLPWRGAEDTGYDDQYDPTRAHGGNR